MPKKMSGKGSGVTKSWFVVLNNPADYGYSGTPEEICNKLRDEWVGSDPNRTGMWAYCISAEGLEHVHMVVEDIKTMRFSMVKKSYPKAHLEPTAGTKKQAEDYIYKRPPFEEKGERIICVVKAGEIRGNQGRRSDLEQIDELLNAGLKPSEIFRENFAYRRYERMVKSAFFDLRKDALPTKREVNVHLLVGASGSGKSYTYVELCKQHGEDEVYLLSDYAIGGFDFYAAESILFMDEYKAQFPYDFLLMILQGYKQQIHARYGNSWALWKDVYITTIFSPEYLYELTVPEVRRTVDSYEQLRRRIADITYCYHPENGEYQKYTIPMSQYTGWDEFKEEAIQALSQPMEQLALPMPEEGALPF